MNDEPKVLSKADEIAPGFYWKFKPKIDGWFCEPVLVNDSLNVCELGCEYAPDSVEQCLNLGYRFIAIPLPDLSEVE